MPSALVMLLPHGMEGAGPEHSSARLERFLQLCDDDEREMQSRDAQIRTANWQIVNPTTPANFFHVLRRQIVRPFRKPLVVMAPKQLLRHPLVKSPLSDFLPDSRFERVLIDPPNTALSRDVSCMVPPYARSRSTPRPKEGEDDVVDPSCKKLLLCSGRIWIDLLAARDDLGERGREVALLRLEQIAPFPYDSLASALERFPNAELIWVQEESINSGAWSYVRPRLEMVAERSNTRGASSPEEPARAVRYAGRRASAAPATGLAQLHTLELEELLREAMS